MKSWQATYSKIFRSIFTDFFSHRSYSLLKLDQARKDKDMEFPTIFMELYTKGTRQNRLTMAILTTTKNISFLMSTTFCHYPSLPGTRQFFFQI